MKASFFHAQPVFGIGYMRSGTTLLFNILRNHPEIFSLEGEPKIIEYLPMVRREYPNLEDDETLRKYICFLVNVVRYSHPLEMVGAPLVETPDFSSEQIDAIYLDASSFRDHITVFRIVYDFFAKASGKTRWFAKTQAFYVDTILQYMPDAMFVEIVRDPRDVLASKKTAKESIWKTEKYALEERARKDLLVAYDPLWDSLSWKSDIRAGREMFRRYQERFFTVRYEDLVTNPVESIVDICKFLGLKFTDQMLRVGVRNSSDWGENITGIGPESIRKYKARLKPEEIYLCQLLSGPEMTQLGYTQEKIKPIGKVKAIVLIFRGSIEFSQRLVNKMKLGGFWYFVSVLNNYWKRFRSLVRSI